MTKLQDLSPRDFENLTYDLLRLSGFENLIWRTPGSDEGRDIEATIFAVDAVGTKIAQRWYVECKRYQSSIPWPIVWEKISYADVKSADFLLIATTNNPSPQCESQIAQWNLDHRTPRIRVWRGYELENLIRIHGVLEIKYGLRAPQSQFNHDFGPIADIMMKTVQVAYVENSLGKIDSFALEASASISELLSYRMQQALRAGQFTNDRKHVNDGLYHWVDNSGDLSHFDFISLRVVLSYWRFVTRCSVITLRVENSIIKISSPSDAAPIRAAAWRSLSAMEPWMGVQMILCESGRSVYLSTPEG